jgi:adenylate cyclase
MYGAKKLYFDWEIEEAEKHFKYALELNHNCITARHRYPILLLITGRFSEALEVLQPLMLIDPLSLISYKRSSRIFYRMGQFKSAISYLEVVLELEPTDYEALVLLGSALAEIGKYNMALSVLKKSINIQYNLDTLAMIGYVSALQGERENALKIINQIESQSEGNFQCSSKLARIYSALGEKEIALSFLNKSFKEHDVDLLGLKSDPRWLKLSNDPRFKEIVSKVGLPID